MVREYHAVQLLHMCNECIYLENEYRMFVKEHHVRGSFMQEELPEYYRLSSATETAWRMFCMACNAVSADEKRVIATVKAINRYERKHPEVSIYVNWSVQSKFIRFWNELD